MLLADFIRQGVASLAGLYSEDEARSMVTILCREMLGVKSWTHIVEPSFRIDEGRLPLLQEAISRLAASEPLQYVLGSAEFCGRTFRVNPSVLIPRPETEQLCTLAVEELRTRASSAPSVLDMCTGSGCIAWTMALSLPGAAVTAVDISAEALQVASSQAFAEEMSRSGALPPVFLRHDVLSSPPDGLPVFDMILSNPPYIKESEKAMMRANVLEHEPSLALFVPDADPLLFYRAVADWAAALLRPGGVGMVEINEALPAETAAVFESAGMQKVLILSDFYKKSRFIRFEK